MTYQTKVCWIVSGSIGRAIASKRGAGEDVLKILLVPSRLLTLDGDAIFAGWLVFQEAEGSAAQDTEILGAMPFTMLSPLVPPEGDAESTRHCLDVPRSPACRGSFSHTSLWPRSGRKSRRARAASPSCSIGRETNA